MAWIMQWVIRETSLHTAGFIYASTGTTTALTCMSWVFTKDWPLNIVVNHILLTGMDTITFELTVLFAAWDGSYFCYLCQLSPFVKKHHFHPRATDDLFVMAIECEPKTNESEVQAFLKMPGLRR
jgi:hypothetical protein